MPSKISRYTLSGWVEVSDLESLDTRLDTAEATIASLSAGVTAQAPAYVGPDTAGIAKFSNTAALQTGLFVYGPTGPVQIVHSTGQEIQFYTRQVAAPGFSMISKFAPSRSQINNVGIGLHPVHGAGYISLWRAGTEGGGDYAFLANALNTFINVADGGTLRFRRNNADTMIIDSNDMVIAAGVVQATGNAQLGNHSVYFPTYNGGWFMADTTWMRTTNNKSVWVGPGIFAGQGGISIGTGGVAPTAPFLVEVAGGGGRFGGQIQSSWNTNPDNVWNNAMILAYQSVNNGQHSRIAINSPGAAPQMRVIGANGEVMQFVTSSDGDYCPLWAKDYIKQSTVRSKKDIRPLRPERDSISTGLDPFSDTVEGIPDIMGLNVVVYRPKVPGIKIEPTDPSGDYATVDPHNPSTFRSVPATGIVGAESTRERIGLLAEEVQHVIPSAVVHGPNGEPEGISYAEITTALLDHVQRLTSEVQTLRYRITELERDQ